MKPLQKRLLSSAIVLLFPFAMAASKYTVTEGHYNYVNVSVNETADVNDARKSNYEFTIKNTGGNYLIADGFRVQFNDWETAKHLYTNTDDRPTLGRHLKAPGESFVVTWNTEKGIDFSQASYWGEAMVPDEKFLDGEGTKAITKGEENIYYIDYKFSDLEQTGYEYAFFAKMSYDEKDYIAEIFQSSNGERFSFRGKEDFDISEASAGEVLVFRCEAYNGPNYVKFVGNFAWFMALIYLSVGLIIVLLVVLPIIFFRRAKKKKKQAEENNIQQ